MCRLFMGAEKEEGYAELAGRRIGAAVRLSDETTREIIREALRLSEREREIVLGIVRQLGEADRAPAREEPGRK